MKNEINAVLENVTATTPEQSDYTGGDGLLLSLIHIFVLQYPLEAVLKIAEERREVAA